MRARAATVYADALAGLPPEARDALMDSLQTIIANLSAPPPTTPTVPERRVAAGSR